MKRHGTAKTITTDELRSYRAAMKDLGCEEKQEVGRWANNRMENSHQPFRRMKTLQQFASTHASFHNHRQHSGEHCWDASWSG
jgi:putative transposase